MGKNKIPDRGNRRSASRFADGDVQLVNHRDAFWEGCPLEYSSLALIRMAPVKYRRNTGFGVKTLTDY
jgi:hypothetical protein